MAEKATPFTLDQLTKDPTAPFYAWVGANHLAVERIRQAAADFEPRDLSTWGEQVNERVETLVKETRSRFAHFDLQQQVTALQDDVRARLAALPEELKELPSRLSELPDEIDRLSDRVSALPEELKELVEKAGTRAGELLAELRADLEESLEESVERYEELVTRGRAYVAQLRDDSLSGDVEILVDVEVREDAEPVRDVPEDVEEAAAEAAARVEAAEVIADEPAKPTD